MSEQKMERGFFTKKPVTIEAVKWTGNNAGEVESFVGTEDLMWAAGKNEPIIRTLEGNHTARIGDWIIKGIKGEFYPCKPDIFEMTYSAASTPEAAGRGDRQCTVADWCARAFGVAQTTSVPHRGVRFLEEAVETAQAAGVDAAMAHKLIDHVYASPAGELSQELGGVGVTVLALASAANLDADECEQREIARVLSKPLEHFAKRNQAKDDAGFAAPPSGEQSQPVEFTHFRCMSCGFRGTITTEEIAKHRSRCASQPPQAAAVPARQDEWSELEKLAANVLRADRAILVLHHGDYSAEVDASPLGLIARARRAAVSDGPYKLALEEARDTILYEHGPLEVNYVLDIIDNAVMNHEPASTQPTQTAVGEGELPPLVVTEEDKREANDARFKQGPTETLWDNCIRRARMVTCRERQLREAIAQRDQYQGAMKAQDERERLAGVKADVPYELHGCDWPDAIAEKVLELIAQRDEANQRADENGTTISKLVDTLEARLRFQDGNQEHPHG